MRLLMILTVGMCLLFAAVPAVAQNAADEAAIREAAEQIRETTNKGDIKSHLDLYADPFENFEDSSDRAAHQQTHDGLKDLRQKLLADGGIVFLTPDVAIHKFRQESTGLIDDDGNPLPPSKSLVAFIYVKKGDKWLMTARFTRPIEE